MPVPPESPCGLPYRETPIPSAELREPRPRKVRPKYRAANRLSSSNVHSPHGACDLHITSRVPEVLPEFRLNQGTRDRMVFGITRNPIFTGFRRTPALAAHPVNNALRSGALTRATRFLNAASCSCKSFITRYSLPLGRSLTREAGIHRRNPVNIAPEATTQKRPFMFDCGKHAKQGFFRNFLFTPAVRSLMMPLYVNALRAPRVTGKIRFESMLKETYGN